MTTPLALGAVTAVLRSRLNAALDASGAVGGATVTALPPDRITTGAQEGNHVNVFLHRVSRNQGWANVAPPPRSGAGDVVANPPLGLDLHYVVTAYGRDPLTADILLGHAVAAFHDEPVLTRSVIRRTLAPNPPDPTIPESFAQSRLGDQLEGLRISATNPGGEEVARLWASFNSPYRPSAFYDVSVVLIESALKARRPFPVLAVGAASVTMDVPEIESITAAGPPQTPITDTTTLVIRGRALAGDGVHVRVGASSAAPTEVGERELQVPVADFGPPLQAGLQGLTVTHDVDLGTPPTPHAAVTSEAAPLALQPRLSFAGNAVTTTESVQVGGVTLQTGTIQATVAPPVGRDQHVVLALTEVGPPPDRPPRGANLPAAPGNSVAANATTTTTVRFPFTRMPAGAYVARVRIDGVDSPVEVDAQGVFSGPKVTL